MQYVLLTVTDNQDDIIFYDSIITENEIYNNSIIKYDNSKIETRVISQGNKEEFFRIFDFLTYETDAKLLDVLRKEGLLNEYN